MHSDSEPQKANTFNPRFMTSERMPADEQARIFAKTVVDHGIAASGDVKIIEKQVYYAWMTGFYMGQNEVTEKWQQYIACQPPPPIKIDANEMSIESYKGFLCRKINKDSKGSWWAKVKLWYKFLIA